MLSSKKICSACERIQRFNRNILWTDKDAVTCQL